MDSFEAGSQIGSYVIVRRLSEGSMGEVYLARHRHIGREAAIKVLRPELSEDKGVVQRFLTEARATAAIRHPGIVEVLDCELLPDGRAYIVMEHLSGETLAQRIARVGGGPRELPEVLSMARQIASALAVAHGLGIVHRDLKPENLFLVGAQTSAVKLLDFGIAKLLHDDGDGRHKTQVGSVLGTPTYMAPEQCRGSSAVDQRADIYALGCVLFEMLVGHPPFVDGGPGDVLVAHLSRTPTRLSEILPVVPARLDDLVAEMLAKDPEARPQTMNQVLDRLATLGQPEEGAAVARVVTEKMPTDAAAEPSTDRIAVAERFVVGGTQVLPRVTGAPPADTTSALDVVEAPRTRARPPWLVPASVAALVVVVLGAIALTRSSPVPSPLPASRPPAPSAEASPRPPAPSAEAAPPPREPPAAARAPAPVESEPPAAASKGPREEVPAPSALASPTEPHHHHHRHKVEEEFKAVGD